jgi:hypothetical protein
VAAASQQDGAPQQVHPVPPAVETEERKDILRRLKRFGPFAFSGDIRLRDEPFFGGPANDSMVRHRMRFRVRFNADAALNENLSGGFTLTSGDVNDPISTNQNTNQFYTRKPFLLDRAFVRYSPGFFKPLTLTGGKFDYPWYRTELTWDKDLNPEGVAETLSFQIANPVLKRVALVGFQLPFAEVAGVSLNNKSIVQSMVYGGQLQTFWQLAPWLRFSAFTGFYNWHNTDPVALAVSVANASSPGNGLLKLKDNNNQNSVTITTARGIVTLNGVPAPTGASTIVNAQYGSKFGLFDSIAKFDFDTGHARWPVTLIADFVQNTRACANVGNIAPPPANTATAVYTQATNAPCDPHARQAYWLEAIAGREQERGDWSIGYTRMFVEREAVLGVFNLSEMRQGTNVEQHRLQVYYMAHRNVEVGWAGYFGRPLVTASSPLEPVLKRLQFDVIYKF